MSTINDYKSYKSYAPQYSSWKYSSDLKEAKRLEYIRQNPDSIKEEDIQRGKTLLRAIDIMDEYSQKRAEDMEVATEQVVGMVSSIAMLLGAGVGLLFKDNKSLKKICSKFVKPANINNASMWVASGIGSIIGMTASSFPLYSWAAKTEIKASKKGRFEAMRKELNDPKTFAILNSEQNQQLEQNLKKLSNKKEKNSLTKGFKESLATIKEMTTESKEFRKQRYEFNKKINDDKQFFDIELTNDEIEKAKQDQQLLTKLVEKIDIASQDYAENAELATSMLSTLILACGTLFSLGYEKLATKLKWKSSIIPHVLTLAGMLGVSIFSNQIQKEASRVGRFKAKQDIMKHPEQLVYISDEKISEITDVKVKQDKKQSMFKFLKEAWKNNKDYQKWNKAEGKKEKNIADAIKNIDLSDEQMKDAKRLQFNTFKTFNKIDEKSQQYSESVEALGQSIQAPIGELCGMIGAAIGLKYLAKTQGADVLGKQIMGFVKYLSICIVSSLPAIGINAYITQEQKKASRVADMLAINELSDYRQFADYSDYKKS